MVNSVINHCRCPQLPCGGTLTDSQPATISPGTSPFIQWFICILLLDIFFLFSQFCVVFIHMHVKNLYIYTQSIPKANNQDRLRPQPQQAHHGGHEESLQTWGDLVQDWSHGQGELAAGEDQEEGTRRWDKEEGQTEGRSRHIHLQDIDLKVSGWVVPEVDAYLQSQQYL